MKRKAIPKRAVSVIIALAMVVTCLVTSYAGSIIPFHGDSGSGQGDVEVNTNGGHVDYEVGDEGSWFSSQYIGSPALGTKCTFTAVDTSTRTFLYWQDEFSGRVVSYERTIQFTVNSKVHLRALYAKVAAATHVVSYVNYGGTILQKSTYNVGAAIKEPTDTKVPGFTFTGWSKSAADAAADPTDQTIYAQYAVNDESYTVTLTNEEYVSGAGTYSNFQTVNLKAEEKNGEGQTFSYWKDDKGNVVSYDRNYSFRINYNATLTAVYGEDVTPEPVIRITKINRDMQDMKITFYAERSVPESYTLVSHGMLMASGVSVSDGSMTVMSASDSSSATIRKVYGTSNESCGTFSLAKAKVPYSAQVTVRPFMIVEDAAGEQFLVYGDILRTSNNATD